MKTTSVVIALSLIISIFVVSCQQKDETVKLQNDQDSLAYALGVANTEGLMQYLEVKMGLDSTQISQVIKGIEYAVANRSENEKAYQVGVGIGRQITMELLPNLNNAIFGKDSVSSINETLFFKGFYDAMQQKAIMNTVDASAYYVEKMNEIQTKLLEQTFGENKVKGIDFLTKNKEQEGVEVTESGLQYKVITAGSGPTPLSSDRVKVHYEGKLIDGKVFDSTLQRNTPMVLPLNQTIPGFSEGLQLMSVGAKFILYLPYDLAYGDAEKEQIPPFSTLIYEVELLEIIK